MYEPLLPRRPRFHSERIAVISVVLSNVFRQVSGFLVSLCKCAVFLAYPPRSRRVAVKSAPEQASSLVPDSDRLVPVFEIGSSEEDASAEVPPWTDAPVPKLPTLIRVLFASCLRNSAVVLVSHLPRYYNRQAVTSESVNDSNICKNKRRAIKI